MSIICGRVETMKEKYRFWATDDVEVIEEVVKLKCSKFVCESAKGAFIKNEWNKWANAKFGTGDIHGGWEKKEGWL